MSPVQKTISALLLVAASSFGASGAFSQDTAAADQTRAAIAKAMGGSAPGFVGSVADAALPGLWGQTVALEMGGDTALDTKTKALISLAVAAQIPCQYCVWMDTNTAKQVGATDQEIAEAVAVAGLTRNWSTNFYGLQVDFETFKKEMGSMSATPPLKSLPGVLRAGQPTMNVK